MHNRAMDALVVDDQPLVREGLCFLLTNAFAFRRCLGAACLAEAERLLRCYTVSPGLVLLDLGLPDATGYQALERIGVLVPDAHLLVCSGLSDTETVRGALSRGACGYLTKNLSAGQIRAALDLVLRGGRYVPPGIHEPEEANAQRALRGLTLTKTQTEILRLLARGSTDGEMAAQLKLSRAAIRAHVAAIVRVLGVRDRGEAAASHAASALLRRPPGEQGTGRPP